MNSRKHALGDQLFRLVLSYHKQRLGVPVDIDLERASFIEIGFTVVQWIMVGPLTAFAFRQLSPRDDLVTAPKTAG